MDSEFDFVEYQELQQPFNQERVIRVEEAQILHVWRSGPQNGLVTISYNDPMNRRSNELVTLIVTPQTAIQNRAGRQVRLDELQSGLRVNAIFSSRMTRSMPPQALAFLIVLLEPRERTRTVEGRVLNVNRRENELVIRERDRGRDDDRGRGRDDDRDDDRNRLRFQITNRTDVFDQRGRRIPFDSLRRDDRVRVTFVVTEGPGRSTRNVATQIQLL